MPVVYLFFAKLLNYGFAIALICGARRMSIAALSIIAFDTLFYAERILLLGRRSETAEFVFLIGLAWWFQRRRAAPRILTAGLVMFGAIAMNSAGDYRAINHRKRVFRLVRSSQDRCARQFRRGGRAWRAGGAQCGAASGIGQRHAILRLRTVSLEHAGVQLCPGAACGPALKESLTLSFDDQIARDYAPPIGSTETGLADAFASFGYLGAFKFFLIGFGMRRIYDAAESGSTGCQIVYPLILAPAMLAITHHTQWPLSALVHMALFLLPALLLAPDPATLAVPGWRAPQDPPS